MKAVVLILSMTLLLTNCKNKKSIDSLEVVNQTPTESNVQVVLDMIVPKDDIFQVFYTEDGTSNFSEEMSVRLVVKGSDLSQKLVFELSEDLVVTRLRIDIGENTEQGSMQINNFTIKYFDKKFETKGNGFFNYFSPTEEITVDYPSSTVTTKKIGESYDPLFYQTDYILNKELEKIQSKDL